MWAGGWQRSCEGRSSTANVKERSNFLTSHFFLPWSDKLDDKNLPSFGFNRKRRHTEFRFGSNFEDNFLGRFGVRKCRPLWHSGRSIPCWMSSWCERQLSPISLTQNSFKHNLLIKHSSFQYKNLRPTQWLKRVQKGLKYLGINWYQKQTKRFEHF